MKATIEYKCEVCGHRSYEQRSVEICEASHVRPEDTRLHAVQGYSRLVPHPEWLALKRPDGTFDLYRRQGSVNAPPTQLTDLEWQVIE
jgi:hypothetical protein